MKIEGDTIGKGTILSGKVGASFISAAVLQR